MQPPDETATAIPTRPRLDARLAAIVALVALVSYFVRGRVDARVRPEPRDVERGAPSGSFTSDPDGFYHARRVARALAEGQIDPRDDRLARVDPSAPPTPIPWPPYYTWIATGWARATLDEASLRVLERPEPSTGAERVGAFGGPPSSERDERPEDAEGAGDADVANKANKANGENGENGENGADGADGADGAERATNSATARQGAGGPNDARAALRERLEAERALERSIGELPRLAGALTSAVVALEAAWLAPTVAPLAALLAGGAHALGFAHLRYSMLGSTDHHAFVALLAALLWWFGGRGLTAARDGSAGAALAFGAGAGAVAGFALGTWVGSLLYVVLVQAALGLGIWLGARTPATDRALSRFGLAFHVVALAVVAPAVARSPWIESAPLDVVDLSLFHVLELSLGALVFVPLARGRLLGAARARYPFVVAAALIAATALWLGLSPDARAAFGWAAGRGGFMSTVRESQPLVGGPIGGFWVTCKYLGVLVLAAPIAWGVALVRVRRGTNHATVQLLVAAPVLLALALAQRRFGDVWIGVQAALVAAWIGPYLLRGSRRPSSSRRASFVWLAVHVLLFWIGTNHSATDQILHHPSAAREGPIPTPERDHQRGMRAALEWLRAQPELGAGECEALRVASAEWSGSRSSSDSQSLSERIGPSLDGRAAVLAQWDLGHAIEWIAARPSIATQFGDYVGVESFLAPWRFFLERDHARAEARMAASDARWVLINARYLRNLDAMVEAVHPDEVERWLRGAPLGEVDDLGAAAERAPEALRPRDGPRIGVVPAESDVPIGASAGASTRALWLDGVGAALLADLGQRAPGLVEGASAPAFLRLAYLSPSWHQGRAVYRPGDVPIVAIFERVPGARLDVEGPPGARFELALRIRYEAAGRDRLWSRGVTLDEAGRARLRLPHWTRAAADEPVVDSDEGRTRTIGGYEWRMNGQRGSLDVEERDVRLGAVLTLR